MIWEIVNLAALVNKSIIQPALAVAPIVVLYLPNYTVENVRTSSIVSSRWEVCKVADPPSEFVLPDCFQSLSIPCFKHRCSALTKKGLQCTRGTFHESELCWQHRIQNEVV